MTLTPKNANAAASWRFNCGPAAICAVLKLSPAEVRPHLGDFEKKGYTNPTLMLDSLRRCGATYRLVHRKDEPIAELITLKLGLIRVQFSGPWTKPGVPMAVRYRQTHWIAARNDSKEIFDINAMSEEFPTGWISFSLWATKLIPWLIKGVCPKGDGGYWFTHAYEVTPSQPTAVQPK